MKDYPFTHSPTHSNERKTIDTESTGQNTLYEVSAAPQFPEGSLQGWLAVIGGSMVSFCTLGVVQSFGVYQDYYRRTALSSHSASQISIIGSMQVFLLFSIGLPAGRLFDSGYFRHCLLSGSMIYLFSVFMLSLAQPGHYYQYFLSQGIGMGLGMGLMFLPSLSITSHYFRKKRSTAMGIVVAGSSLGGVVYPVILNNIFPKSSGFRWGVRGVGFIDLGLLLTANLIMRTRLPPKSRSESGGEATYKQVLTDSVFLVYIFGGFLVFWGTFVPFFYLQVFASSHAINPKFSIYAITIMNGASVFGRTIPNMIADLYGPVNILMISGVICGGLMFAMLAAKNVVGITLFAILYGFFSGGLVSLVAPGIGSFITHKDASDLGIRLGMLSLSLSFALLTGNPIAGALLTDHFIWHRPLVFAALALFVGVLCNALTWRTISRRRNSKRV